MENVEVKHSKKIFWMQILKGTLMAVSFSLVAILVFALIIKFVGITDTLISPINQVIKVISIFIGCYYSLRGNNYKGLLKGIYIGLFYTMLAFILFSSLSRSFALNLTFLNDILFGMIIGAICGIIIVNLKKNK